MYTLTAEEVTIVVDSTAYYEVNSDGSLGGPYGMIYEKAFNAVGYDVKLLELPTRRGIEVFFANGADAHSPGALYITGDLQNNIIWVPIGKIASVYVYYKPQGINIDIPSGSLEDRLGFFKQQGMTVALSSTSPVLAYYEQAGIRIIKTDSLKQEVQLLKSGRVDFSINDYFATIMTIAEFFPTELDNFGFVFVPPYETSLAFSKGNPKAQELYNKFQQGLNTIKNNGTYMDIMEQFWGQGNVPKIVLPDDLVQFGVETLDPDKIPLP